MTKEQIERINALARKSRAPQGLTASEQEEQKALRGQYLADIRASLESQLEHTSVQEPDGTIHKLAPKKPGRPN